MPELPEVETIKNDLTKKILKKKISQITIRLPKVVRNSKSYFKKSLLNHHFQDITRRGKLIIFKINTNLFLLIHLRMTGQLIYQNKDELTAGGHSEKETDWQLPGKHTHIFFTFSDKSKLFFNDLRQFGFLKIVNQKELNQALSKFGLEPLDRNFTIKKFRELLLSKKRNIKAFLLDQSIIAGIGNIYADEILFASHISPLRQTDNLKAGEITNLHREIKKILRKAIRHRGTTFNNFVDSSGQKGNFTKFLRIYQKENQKCPNCKQPVKKTKVAGRGTRYCPECQK